jgi:hypothetical protein
MDSDIEESPEIDEYQVDEIYHGSMGIEKYLWYVAQYIFCDVKQGIRRSGQFLLNLLSYSLFCFVIGA